MFLLFSYSHWVLGAVDLSTTVYISSYSHWTLVWTLSEQLSSTLCTSSKFWLEQGHGDCGGHVGEHGCRGANTGAGVISNDGHITVCACILVLGHHCCHHQWCWWWWLSCHCVHVCVLVLGPLLSSLLSSSMPVMVVVAVTSVRACGHIGGGHYCHCCCQCQW